MLSPVSPEWPGDRFCCERIPEPPDGERPERERRREGVGTLHSVVWRQRKLLTEVRLEWERKVSWEDLEAVALAKLFNVLLTG